MPEKFYVTTPIYYVNDVPHIGHAYTTIIADILARYHELKGAHTFFLTGTDEHGQKIEQAARSRGKTPAEYSDTISSTFRSLWDYFGIRYDRFIRTTDESHKVGVQKAFETMLAKGDIYKGEYVGHYCVSCETFFTETQITKDHNCPDCGKATQLLKEESYFFRLSAYQDRLLTWYDANEKCILPTSRKSEVVRFVEGGLDDLSISRTSFTWGIPLPASVGDPKHVIYVWLDALMNYVTALGYGSHSENMDLWPADYHLIGKDILRFHAIFWPAFLMSLELPLPKHIAVHGWWTRDGAKMSKSKGNVVDPKKMADLYHLDSFRYFLVREVPFGQDGDFGQRALIDRINNDLGNDLGNLLNRLIGMSYKYFDGVIVSGQCEKYYSEELKRIQTVIGELDQLMVDIQINRYLEYLWRILSIGNKAIDSAKPWVRMKEGKEAEVQALLGFIANLLAKVALLLHPIMPEITLEMGRALKITLDAASFKTYVTEGQLLADFTIEKVPPLFPKIEVPLIAEASGGLSIAAP